MSNTYGTHKPLQSSTRRIAFRRHRSVWKPRSFVWLLPSLLLVGGLIGYPTVLMFVTSFSRQNYTGSLVGWAGLDNYRRVFADPTLPTVFLNTIIWTASVVTGTLILSLFVSLLLNAAWPGRRIVRAMLIIPWATSVVTTTLVFRWMLDSQLGAINLLLTELHLIAEPIRFLAGPSTSFPALISVGIYLSIPLTTYLLLAGLHSIPAEVYEAARIDGAGSWQQLRSITLPLLGPFLSMATLLNIIYVFNSFPIIWILTGGGPANQTDTIITYFYRQAFSVGDVTGASAISTLGFMFLALLGVAYWFLLQRRRWQ